MNTDNLNQQKELVTAILKAGEFISKSAYRPSTYIVKDYNPDTMNIINKIYDKYSDNCKTD
jgi:hypothetical protein